MLVIGDMDRIKIYTLSELEKKEKLEMVLANEFDIFSLTGVDAKDKKCLKASIKKIIKRNPCGYDHKCACPIQNLKKIKYMPARDLVPYNNKKYSLDIEQVGYSVPRNSAFGKEFKNLLLLVKYIIISKKENITIPFEFFIAWLGLNICVIALLYIEKYIL